MTAETPEPEQDFNMEFFRLMNHAVGPEEEIKMGIRAALELTFGKDAKTYGRGVIGWTESDES